MTNTKEKFYFLIFLFSLYGLVLIGNKISENHRRETGNYMLVKAASGNLSYSYFYFGAKPINNAQKNKPKSIF